MPAQSRPAWRTSSIPSQAAEGAVKNTPLNRSSDARNLLVCLAVLVAEIFFVWPFADIAYGDDVAYSHMAFLLSRTGHLVFNGWEAAMMVQQAYWGALFIKLFGFSFLSIRLSTVPFAVGVVAFCYLLARRAGLRSVMASFVTLLLALSPLYLPLAVSYMTDVPALFFFFLSFYAFVCVAENSGDVRGYGWIILGIVSGLLGGSTRQYVWFVPLVVLPYLAWIRQKDVRFASACLAGWLISIGCVAGMTSWFNRQLYIVPTPSLLSEFKLAAKRPASEIEMSARLLLMLLLMCLPAALPLVLRSLTNTWNDGRGRKLLVSVLLLAVMSAIAIHPSLASIPWVASTLNWEGINGDAPLPGRPIVLTRPIRAVIALAVYVTVCILAAEVTKIPEVTGRLWRTFRAPKETEFAFAAMCLVSLVYFCVTVLRAVEFNIFDRYLVPLIPCAAITLLRPFETQNPDTKLILRRTMPFAWGLLAILGLYAILTTQDYWSLAQARVVATRRLEAGGVPRTAIDAGMEYNGWTQLMVNGQLNWQWVKNPPGAYRPGFGITPEVVPLYRLEYAPLPSETVPTAYGTVPYFSLLPPFHKQVSIDRIVH